MEDEKLSNYVYPIAITYTVLDVIAVITIIILAALKIVPVWSIFVCLFAPIPELIIFWSLSATINKVNDILTRKYVKKRAVDDSRKSVVNTNKSIESYSEHFVLCSKCGYQIFDDDEKCQNCGYVFKK